MPIDKLGFYKPAAIERSSQVRSPAEVPPAKAAEEQAEAAKLEQAQQPTLETIQRVAAQLDSYMKSIGRKIEFQVDGDSGRTVVKVKDTETGELIRQMPSEEVLRLARSTDTNSLFVSLTA